MAEPIKFFFFVYRYGLWYHRMSDEGSIGRYWKILVIRDCSLNTDHSAADCLLLQTENKTFAGLNGARVFAIANKDGTANRHFLITQRIPYIGHRMSDKGSIERYWLHVTVR